MCCRENPQAKGLLSGIARHLRKRRQGGDACCCTFRREKGERYGFDACSASVEARLRLAVILSDRYVQDEAFLQALYEIIGTGLPSSESVPAVLAIVYRTGRDLMKSIRLCANASGDTDTMGAIAGAVCGAYQGGSKIDLKYSAAVCKINPFPFNKTAEQFALRASKKDNQGLIQL